MRNQPVSILVIDDDGPSRRLFAAILEAQGYDVVEATTGQSGIDLARVIRPALIILDLELPDTSGIQVALALKTDTRTWAIPILATTAAPDSARARIHASHCDGVAAKPVYFPDFLGAVETVLGRLATADLGCQRDD